jgi:hypothetical protein
MQGPAHSRMGRPSEQRAVLQPMTCCKDSACSVSLLTFPSTLAAELRSRTETEHYIRLCAHLKERLWRNPSHPGCLVLGTVRCGLTARGGHDRTSRLDLALDGTAGFWASLANRAISSLWLRPFATTANRRRKADCQASAANLDPERGVSRSSMQAGVSLRPIR